MEKLNDKDREVISEVTRLRMGRDVHFITISEKYRCEAEESLNKRLASEILFQQIVYYNNVTGDYKLSNRLAVLCLHYANLLGNDILEANVLRMMGVNYHCLGNVLEARKVYDEGIAILERKMGISREGKEILAGLYFNIVTLYKELEIDESRLQFIDKAFKLFTEIENKQGIARCYIAYANNFPDIKNSGLVIEYYRLAADIFAKIDDQRGLGNCQVGIGYQLGLMGEFDEAMKLLNDGIDKLNKSSNSFAAMQGYFNLGIVLRLQHKYDDAIYYFKQVRATAARYGADMNMMFVYEELAKTHEEKGDFKEALDYRKLYQAERDKAHEFDKATTEKGF